MRYIKKDEVVLLENAVRELEIHQTTNPNSPEAWRNRMKAIYQIKSVLVTI